MTITVDDTISLELISEIHTQPIFDMVDANRTHLRVWLPFVDRMQTVDFTKNFVSGTMQCNLEGMEYAFVIIENKKTVGRIGVYKIDSQNKIGEIGYWITEEAQGKGIVTRSCNALLDFCFNELHLNRIEIRCGVENIKSKGIPEQLGFTHEGIIREGELLYEQFIDLHLYALLKKRKV